MLHVLTINGKNNYHARMETKQNNIELWRWRELKKHIPFGRTTIWAMCKNGTFPAPCKIGKSAIAWRSDEVLAWIESRERA